MCLVLIGSMAKGKEIQFDEVFKHVKSFGFYQHCVYWSLALLKFPMAFQFLFLIFAFGSQKFQCTSSNVTCPVNKCCQNCTSYSFDKTFVSAVSEVCVYSTIRGRLYEGDIHDRD